MTNLVGHRITLSLQVERGTRATPTSPVFYDTIVQRGMRQEYAMPTEPFHQLRQAFEREFSDMIREHDRQLGLEEREQQLDLFPPMDDEAA